MAWMINTTARDFIPEEGGAMTGTGACFWLSGLMSPVAMEPESFFSKLDKPRPEKKSSISEVLELVLTNWLPLDWTTFSDILI